MKTLKPMKTLKSVYWLCALSFILCASMKCKKELITPVPKLPAETQTGARTFGCLVDGEIYVPTGKSMLPAITTSIQFEILNLKTNKGDEAVIFNISSFNIVGDYNLSTTNNTAQFIKGANIYKSTNGTLTIIKYDKVNRIISGRFFFTGKDDITGKTLTITEGRFDVPFTN